MTLTLLPLLADPEYHMAMWLLVLFLACMWLFLRHTERKEYDRLIAADLEASQRARLDALRSSLASMRRAVGHGATFDDTTTKTWIAMRDVEEIGTEEYAILTEIVVLMRLNSK